MNTASLYRALDFELRHPPTMHPVVSAQRTAAAASGHSCQPAVLERRRRAAQLHRFLGEHTSTATAATAAPTAATVATTTAAATAPSATPEQSPAASVETRPGCAERPRPAAAPSRLGRLAEAVRESRQQPCVEGADLDRALAGQHPLQDTARRLLERVKGENRLLQLPSARRGGSSDAWAAGRSLAPGGRRGLLNPVRVGEDDRERRKRMFSILYK